MLVRAARRGAQDRSRAPPEPGLNRTRALERNRRSAAQAAGRFQREGVKYILVGGHAVRLNGFLRSTEDIDILLPASIENGRRVIKALNFLSSAAELRPEWFASSTDEPENIRVADDLLIDLLLRRMARLMESLHAHVRTLTVEGWTSTRSISRVCSRPRPITRDKDLIDRKPVADP